MRTVALHFYHVGLGPITKRATGETTLERARREQVFFAVACGE